MTDLNKKGEIKEVSDGYAMNFLIKKGYALKKTEGSLNKLKEQNKKVKESNGKMFGSISTKQIKEELKKLGFDIEKNNIENTTINTLGMHNVNITLYKDITCVLKVHTEG